jgi:hypothetical protein
MKDALYIIAVSLIIGIVLITILYQLYAPLVAALGVL